MDVPFSNMAVPTCSAAEKSPNKSSLADKLRKPFKKRHSTVYHQPTSRVNKYLAQAIEARSVDQEKSIHINVITLCFKDSSKERQYYGEKDEGFISSLICCLIILLLLGFLQAVVLTRSLLVVVLFIASFVWLFLLIFLTVGANLKSFKWDMSRYFPVRIASIVSTILFIYSVAQANVFLCAPESGCFPLSTNISHSSLLDDHYFCPLPQYVIISCILTLFSVVVFLRFPIIIKGMLLLPMTTVFIVVITVTHHHLFECYDIRVGSRVPEFTIGIVVIVHFLLAVLIHGRQVEWTARLDFLWNMQANEEKREMHELQSSNRRILFNLLPAHVATHFLDNQFKNNMDLYNQSYSKVGVVFASIPNFHEFYMELDGNNQGMECLRLLNEIIADFDELLDDERFKAIDKIKTVGSTYMAAIGLMPEYRIADDSVSSAIEYMSILAEMVFAFKDKLADINENSYNNFFLRVGINIGPVVAGVIGASKPQYDIWGNTVNVASRMDSTGLPNHIQTTEEVYMLLKDGYVFQCRGIVKVKGKGDMTTYFLLHRKQGGDLRENEDSEYHETCANKTNLLLQVSAPASMSPETTYTRGIKSYQPTSTNEILSTSSPRLPTMQLPPWQPSTHQMSFSEESQASELYDQPKPIVGNAPTKSYSQSRPHYNSHSSGNEENTNSPNSLPELKDDLQNRLQKLNTGVSPYTSKVYRPSKIYAQPKANPAHRNAASALTPPEENLTQHSPVQETPTLTSDLDTSGAASSSRESLLDHYISIDNSSLNRSSTSSCDSYVCTDFSRTDVDTPSPALYDDNTNVPWVYPPNENAKQQFIIGDPCLSEGSGKKSLPEVGLSPSRTITPNLSNARNSLGPLNALQGKYLNSRKDCLGEKCGSKHQARGNTKTSSSQQTDFDGKFIHGNKYLKSKISDDPPQPYKFDKLGKEDSRLNSDIAKRVLNQGLKNDNLSGANKLKRELGSYHSPRNSPRKDLKDFNKVLEEMAEDKARKGTEDESINFIFDESRENSNSKQNESLIGLHFDPLHKKMTLSLLNSPEQSINGNKKSDSAAQALTKPLANCKLPVPLVAGSFKRATDKEVENNLAKNNDDNKIAPRAAVAELTDSESDDEKSSEIPLIDDQDYGIDDPALENASLLNEQGLTDAEGALSDLNSIINDPGHDADMDDTSISSRASSRMFDSDQLLSVDSLNVMYDSEYDNYRPGTVSDDDIFHQDPSTNADMDYRDDPHIENIRVLSNNITRNFGISSQDEKDESEVG